MAQAPAANPTDDLLSQLAASEIDRLLAEADKATVVADPAPVAPIADELEPAQAPQSSPTPAASSDTVTEGSEKDALLKAAGFESADHESADACTGDQPSGDERSALLKAAGFESIEDAVAIKSLDDAERPLPVYFKPLVWINAPLASCPEKTRQALGKIGIVTFVNALAVLTYLFIRHKH